MGLLGGMPQTDYDFLHNTAPSSALVGRQVPTGSVAITENWFPPDYTFKTVILDLKHPDFRNIPYCTI